MTISYSLNTISSRIPALVIGSGLVLSIALGVSSYWQSSGSQSKAIQSSLSAIAEGRKTSLKQYLSSIEQDLHVTANNPAVVMALEEFSRTWNDVPGEAESYLQAHYIEKNPHPTGKKDELDAAEDGSEYSSVHGAYHPWFRAMLRERGYYDIFLFNTNGDLVYSVFKELDYATNLNAGKWKDTDLGNVFRAAMSVPEPGAVSFFDFKPYAPSFEAPASFISLPVFDKHGKKIGVLAFQMPIDRLNQVMASSAGLGQTGEAYILGADRLMRSDSIRTEESTILKQKVDNIAVSNALAGQKGVVTAESYKGGEAIIAYNPLNFHGTKWSIIVEQDLNEAMIPVVENRNTMLLTSVSILLVVGIVCFLLSRAIVRPIVQLTRSMQQLAEGNVEQDIPGQSRIDELGEMAKTVEVFKQNRIARKSLESEQETQRKKDKLHTDNLRRLIDTFQSDSRRILSGFDSALKEMQTTLQSMSTAADQADGLAKEVASASSRASHNVQNVSSATEQLSSSITEIETRVSRAHEMTTKTVESASKTSSVVGEMADAAAAINSVIGLITDIAEKTNLLALNATIEAARAGEAGKGFAVVASEVKSLANQTATAIEQIHSQVGRIKATSENSVNAIADIEKWIGEVNQIATEIATAVGEQSSSSQEIARSVVEAAEGTQEVDSHIAGVSDVSIQTKQSSEAVQKASADLAAEARGLENQIKKFLSDVQAA